MKDLIKEKANLNFRQYALSTYFDEELISLSLYDFKIFMAGVLLLTKNILRSKKTFPIKEIKKEIKKEAKKAVLATIYIDTHKSDGSPYAEVAYAAAQQKLGPMIYDSGLIYASSLGYDLIPDRITVSDSATKIYMNWYETGQGATGIPIQYVDLESIKAPYSLQSRLPDLFKNKNPYIDVGYFTPYIPNWYSALIRKNKIFCKSYFNALNELNLEDGKTKEKLLNIGAVIESSAGALFMKLYKGPRG